jgi:hypothetical protein
MVKLPVEAYVDYDVLPEDTIIGVQVADIRPKDVPARNGREGWTKLEFKFLIQDIPTDLLSRGDGFRELLGTHIWGSTGMRLTTHVDNRLRQWAEALLNIGTLDEGFELDTDLLIGRNARAVVSNYTKNNGSSAHQVGALLPASSSVAGSNGAASAIPRPGVSPMLDADGKAAAGVAGKLAAGTSAVPVYATSVSAGEPENIPF